MKALRMWRCACLGAVMIACGVTGSLAQEMGAGAEAAETDIAMRLSGRGPAIQPTELIGQIVQAAVANQLAGAQCIETPELAACIAPGTPETRIRQILDALPLPNAHLAYNQSSRWTYTATDGSVASGAPLTLTYSFVPDGVNVPGTMGEPASPSNFLAKMDAAFGGNRALWKAKFAQAFAQWSAVCRISYMEVGDDSAAFDSSPGVSGQRGDIRIAGHNIDGPYSVLAYARYPNGGDMVFDTSEEWGSSGNDYRLLRNTIIHEHGHGIGLGHVYPTDNTKIMEPMLSLNFDGPQDDDIRGALVNYGDPFEPNNSAATAINLGMVSAGGVEKGFLATANASDQDWFKFSVVAGVVLNVRVSPTGGVYQVGESSGSTPTIDTESINDLQIQVYGSGGSALLVTQNASPKGTDEVLSNYALPGAGGEFFVKISDAPGSIGDVQRYSLSLSAVGPIYAPPHITDVIASPYLVAAGDPVHVSVWASDAEGLSGVTANGVALTFNGASWQGAIIANSGFTTHAITVIATATGGQIASDTSASYRDARVVCVGGIGARAVPPVANSGFLFKTWGRVVSSDASSFDIDDGSGARVRIIAPGHSMHPGDYVEARGILNSALVPPEITASLEHIIRVD